MTLTYEKTSSPLDLSVRVVSRATSHCIAAAGGERQSSFIHRPLTPDVSYRPSSLTHCKAPTFRNDRGGRFHIPSLPSLPHLLPLSPVPSLSCPPPPGFSHAWPQLFAKRADAADASACSGLAGFRADYSHTHSLTYLLVLTCETSIILLMAVSLRRAVLGQWRG